MNLNFSTELEITPQQKFYNILLIGESCKDEYHYGYCNRICPEAPVPVFEYAREETRPGMAANVKENLLSFSNVKIDFLTNDANLLIKRRFVDSKSNQLLLREDIEQTITPVVFPDSYPYDAVVVSDYCKGILDVEQIKKLCKLYNGPIFVDSKNTDLCEFKSAIIKINNDEEAKLKYYSSDSELVVTMGKNGAKWRDKIFPAPKVDVFDVTGAGDVFLASLCYFYLVTKDMAQAIQKAVNLASKSVQDMGVYKLTEKDIEDELT
jgi:bifunctional ADP-heptose synthase (sugar kinase/adenylyltransferase)